MTDQTEDSSQEFSTSGAWKWILQRLEVPGWGRVLVIFLFFVGAWIFRTTSRLENDLGDVHREMQAVDSSVRVLASLQSQSVQNLIRDLLAKAVNSAEQGDAQAAETATKQLTVVVEAAKNGKVPMKLEAFHSAQSGLDKILKDSTNPGLTSSATDAKFALGKYEMAVTNQEIQKKLPENPTLEFTPAKKE